MSDTSHAPVADAVATDAADAPEEGQGAAAQEGAYVTDPAAGVVLPGSQGVAAPAEGPAQEGAAPSGEATSAAPATGAETAAEPPGSEGEPARDKAFFQSRHDKLLAMLGAKTYEEAADRATEVGRMASVLDRLQADPQMAEYALSTILGHDGLRQEGGQPPARTPQGGYPDGYSAGGDGQTAPAASPATGTTPPGDFGSRPGRQGAIRLPAPLQEQIDLSKHDLDPELAGAVRAQQEAYNSLLGSLGPIVEMANSALAQEAARQEEQQQILAVAQTYYGGGKNGLTWQQAAEAARRLRSPEGMRRALMAVLDAPDTAPGAPPEPRPDAGAEAEKAAAVAEQIAAMQSQKADLAPSGSAAPSAARPAFSSEAADGVITGSW